MSLACLVENFDKVKRDSFVFKCITENLSSIHVGHSSDNQLGVSMLHRFLSTNQPSSPCNQQTSYSFTPQAWRHRKRNHPQAFLTLLLRQLELQDEKSSLTLQASHPRYSNNNNSPSSTTPSQLSNAKVGDSCSLLDYDTYKNLIRTTPLP